MINYIFGLFIIIGIIYGLFTGNINSINDSLLVSGSDSIKMVMKIIPMLCLWLGVMRIAEVSGLIKKISRLLSRVIHPLFPELNRDSNAISYIASSMVMNMLGLGNGATPMGLRAMECMEDENNNKGIASRSMITFLVINTAGVTIIPTTVISMRLLNKSNNPSDIIPACIITTILSCMFGLLFDRLFSYIWRSNNG